ncbi:type II toxin-antitoxin system death-on-curing family toxin [Shimia litoralis]|uniref:Type II toxin-antitoxin system death-on-curing family toxin n=1 Tax=Shimia litoralis TaxID=420403 RepID=A0A4U7N871_9RHOB|nr:type II toxin-antitoxin system death-on-curing family toxin [Shimia litoralis]TKZ20794.1 type II toxin-antitoxin system death-on-curing family toxin [Shimia litoralis]
MSTPIWVPLQAVLIIHDRQIARHGGAAGLRDLTLLEAAMERPRNKFAYGETDLDWLTAAYAFGVAKAHAFVDGNKRTAFVTAATFLRLNGFGLHPEALEGVSVMENLASDTLSEEEFAAWIAKLKIPIGR